MNLDQLTAKLDGMVNTIREEFVREMERIAMDGTAIVTQRVSETGKDANGAPFKPYTKRYELYKRGAVGTAKKEGAAKRAARRTAPASAEKPVGRYRGFVDFTLSGQMLSSIGIVDTRADGNRVAIKVAGRDEETRGKMEGNDTHRPGWFLLSADETQRLAARSQVRMAKWAENYLKA
jgi:hypothetical protein